MHDDCVGLGIAQFFLVEAVEAVVLADGRNHLAAGALVLEAQHHDHIGALEAFVHVGEDLCGKRFDAARQQRARRDDAGANIHGAEQQQVRAGDAGIGDIAADGDGEPGKVTLVLADGEGIEQRLGGVFMRAVAGIDHRAADLLAEEFHRTGRSVPDDDDVGLHGVEGRRGIDQCLALAHRRGPDRHVGDLRAQPLAGDLEARLGAGRRLEE